MVNRRIRDGAEQLRRIASRTPSWTVIERDDQTLLWDTREDRLLATLHGQWTPDVARYLATLNPHTAITLAELLWAIGTTGGPVEQNAARLLDAMNLHDAQP